MQVIARSRSILILVALLAWLLAGCDRNLAGNDSDPGGPPETKDGKPALEKPVSPDIAVSSFARRIPVIMYHDIVEKRGKGTVWFDCTADEFSAQMEMIREEGYTPITLKQLEDHLRGIEPAPEKAIVLTFDDNYQGFYDYAYPIIQAYKYPVAMFVHTGFVGKQEGHPKMSWETLGYLVKDGLVTIGSHTVTHPKLTGLDRISQVVELRDSKTELEDKLAIKVDYLAYPEGDHDETSIEISKELGYKMAFTVENGPAEMSPSIMEVNRYVHTRMEKALQECDQSLRAAPGPVEMAIKSGPVQFATDKKKPNDIVFVKGGLAQAVMSETRESVSQFIGRTPGAVAGINGTFFAMAAIASTDNQLVGPCITADRLGFYPDTETTRWDKLRYRPVIMWDEEKVAVVPFSPALMVKSEFLTYFMPKPKTLFLGGAWLVHDGAAILKDDMTLYASKDIMDFRRRAAFGFTQEGQFFAAATRNSVDSATFAAGLAEAGAQEAILLDSGFSTSLVYNDKVLASGHSTKDSPSRPVPHAILFMGEPDPDSVAAVAKEEAATAPNAEQKSNTRRRRRR